MKTALLVLALVLAQGQQLYHAEGTISFADSRGFFFRDMKNDIRWELTYSKSCKVWVDGSPSSPKAIPKDGGHAIVKFTPTGTPRGVVSEVRMYFKKSPKKEDQP